MWGPTWESPVCTAAASPAQAGRDHRPADRARPRTTRPHHPIHLLPGVRKALVGHPPRCPGPRRRLAPAGSLHHRYGLCAGRAVPAVGRDRHAAAPATKRGPDHRRERYPKASLDLRPALTRRATFGAILGRTSTSAPSCRPSADPLETPCGPTTLRAPQPVTLRSPPDLAKSPSLGATGSEPLVRDRRHGRRRYRPRHGRCHSDEAAWPQAPLGPIGWCLSVGAAPAESSLPPALSGRRTSWPPPPQRHRHWPNWTRQSQVAP